MKFFELELNRFGVTAAAATVAASVLLSGCSKDSTYSRCFTSPVDVANGKEGLNTGAPREAILAIMKKYGGVSQESIDAGLYTGVGAMVETRSEHIGDQNAASLTQRAVFGVKITFSGIAPDTSKGGVVEWGPGSLAFTTNAEAELAGAVALQPFEVNCSTGQPLTQLPVK